METVEAQIINAISVEDVRNTISGIESATCGIFGDGQDYYVNKSNLNKAHEVNEGIREGETRLFKRLKPEFNSHFPQTDGGALKTLANFNGNIFVLLDQSNPKVNLVKIACGTARDPSLRSYPIFFELNFGNNADSAAELLDKIKDNPLYIKSVVERVFSPSSNPTDGPLRGNMNTFDKYDISPFIDLPYVKEVATKRILS